MNQKDFNSGSVVSNYLNDIKIVERFKKIAQADNSVLITGETGVGKELVAWLIYANSNRSKSKFVTVNCGSISSDLLESLMFGHKKGSFTSAIRDHKGFFEEANGGTIFLDELCETTINFQTNLLRVIENKVIRKVGDDKDTPINVRVLAACNKNIHIEVKNGNFREDLYYRLNTFQIHIPPLRDRVEDIYLLAEYFTDLFTSQYNKNLVGISNEAVKMLLNHDWKGNVRELKNTIEYAVVMADSETIKPDNLPQNIHHIDSPYSRFYPDTDTSVQTENRVENELNNPVIPAKQTLVIDENKSQFYDINESLDFEKSKENFEKQYLLNLLEITKGNILDIVSISKMNRQKIYRKLKKYGIDAEIFRNK